MRILSGVLAAIVAAVAVIAMHGGVRASQDTTLGPAMIGTWTGNARIVVNWTTQKVLPVRVTIAPDGQVTGTVGDATLRDARLQRNRGVLGRALHVKTDWIISGKLDGPIIGPESIRRESVKLPLNWLDDHFEGGVNTSGSEAGGAKSMWLAAHDLRLDRAAPK